MLIKNKDLDKIVTLLKQDIDTYNTGSDTYAVNRFASCIFLPEVDDLLYSYITFVAYHTKPNNYIHIANFDINDKENRREVARAGFDPSKYFDMDGLWISYEALKAAVKFASLLYDLPQSKEKDYLFSPYYGVFSVISRFEETHQYCKMDHYVKNIGLPYLKKYFELSNELHKVEEAIKNNTDCDVSINPKKIIDSLDFYVFHQKEIDNKSILLEIYNEYGNQFSSFKIKPF